VPLSEEVRFREWGLGDAELRRLEVLRDRIAGAGFNVTGIREPEAIERLHLLDSLSLLSLQALLSAVRIADIGSGAGLPALVLAIVLPASITAVESQKKKCDFIVDAAKAIGLDNVEVCWARAEDYAHESGREDQDVVVSRALASLPVLAEYSLPLLREGGTMVALKGQISDEERIQAQKALDILGGGALESIRLDPFPGADNRWAFVAEKVGATAPEYPRRAGIPSKRPLGARSGG